MILAQRELLTLAKSESEREHSGEAGTAQMELASLLIVPPGQ